MVNLHLFSDVARNYLLVRDLPQTKFKANPGLLFLISYIILTFSIFYFSIVGLPLFNCTKWPRKKELFSCCFGVGIGLEREFLVTLEFPSLNFPRNLLVNILLSVNSPSLIVLWCCQELPFSSWSSPNQV